MQANLIRDIIDTGVKATDSEIGTRAPYYAQLIAISRDEWQWQIFKRSEENDELIGEYTSAGRIRCPSVWKLFHPFELRGKWYALYSKGLYSIYLMELPSCREIGYLDMPLCPLDFWVPPLAYQANGKWEHPERIHGFVVVSDDLVMGACYMHYLDLSRADEGIIACNSEEYELPEGGRSYYNQLSDVMRIEYDKEVTRVTLPLADGETTLTLKNEADQEPNMKSLWMTEEGYHYLTSIPGWPGCQGSVNAFKKGNFWCMKIAKENAFAIRERLGDCLRADGIYNDMLEAFFWNEDDDN
jgi:hypothetical protein